MNSPPKKLIPEEIPVNEPKSLTLDMNTFESEKPKPPKRQKITFPMKKDEAKERLGEYLLPGEMGEIDEIGTVYFLNLLERKAHLEMPEGKFNGGWDNENGEYLYRMYDHLAFRFEITKELGKGSFGVVL